MKLYRNSFFGFAALPNRLFAAHKCPSAGSFQRE
jgi:hypothetical protein